MPKNGTIWKIVSIVITIIIVAGGIIYGYASLEHQVADNAKMQPKVDTHETYIDGDKVDTKYIKRDISDIRTKIENIETVQRQILVEVRK